MKPTKFDLSLSPTVPCTSSADSSIAAEIVTEAHAVLAVMPTGEWRRSLRLRLSGLEGAVDSWRECAPSDVERREVTAEALDFFYEMRDRRERAP